MSKPLIGMVTVAGKVFTVEAMSLNKELRLGMKLRQLYEVENGSVYAKLRPILDEMTPIDRSDAVAVLTRTKVAGDLPGGDARELARLTPKGAALELYTRARKNHPGLTLAECEAIVTKINCEEVIEDIEEALTPKDGDDDSKS